MNEPLLPDSTGVRPNRLRTSLCRRKYNEVSKINGRYALQHVNIKKVASQRQANTVIKNIKIIKTPFFLVHEIITYNPSILN